jgi:hypothetical protein
MTMFTIARPYNIIEFFCARTAGGPEMRRIAVVLSEMRVRHRFSAAGEGFSKSAGSTDGLISIVLYSV